MAFLPGVLSFSNHYPTASMRVSPKRVALGSLFLVPSSVNPIAVARYSPKESHLK